MHRPLCILFVLLTSPGSWAATVNELPWSFKPLKSATLPNIQQPDWPQTRLDHFILSRMEKEGLQPAKAAEDRVILRRLYFDLIGLPPTQKQMDTFKREDFAKTVDQLLASPHYGERWGRHWLDLARYTDKTASWLNSTASAWLYRDWVVKALNDDLPYNTFVKKQLANDLMAGSDPKDNAALGFLGLSPTYWKELQLPPEIIKTTVADEWEEHMDALGRTFLGLAFGCARCHDHKSDPVTQEDYYAIAGVFASVRITDRPMMKEELWVPVAKAREKVAALEKKLAELKKKKSAAQVLGTKVPEFSRDYAGAIEKLKPTFHAPLNVASKNLTPESGVQILKDKFATFGSGRMRGEVKTLRDAYTVSFWFRNNLANNARPVTAYLFSRGQDGDSRAPGDHLGIGGTSTQADGTLFLFNGNVAKGSVGGKTVIAPGGWNHVVFLRSGSNVRAYLNGATQPEFEGEIKSTAAGSREIFIGGRNDRFALLSGHVAHFTFFDRALTAKEALQLHTASGQPKGSKTEPKESTKTVIAQADPKAQIEKVTREMEAIKKNTPHYNMPLVNGVSEAALFVNPAKGKHGTSLDYKKGEARNLSLHKRGNPNITGKVVPRRFLNAFPVKNGQVRQFKNGSGRLDLAEAIVNEAAPLAARVIVNRVWLHHFGSGLTSTPSDLGSGGDAPTHPQLLNDLATRFVKNGWSLKWLHREILLSACWQQSIHSNQSQKLDPLNKLYGRMNRRRLDVEAWRDAMLQASGQLDPSLGGDPMNLESKDNKRRTLYGLIHRREPNQMLRIHDFPDPTAHAPSRPQTITPLQQLFALNGPFIQWQAEALAANLMKQTGTEARVNIAYEKLFQRTPRQTERKIATAFFNGTKNDKAAWTQYTHALLASNEFLFIE